LQSGAVADAAGDWLSGCHVINSVDKWLRGKRAKILPETKTIKFEVMAL